MNGAVVRGAPPLAEILFKVRVLSADDPKAKGVKLISEPGGQRAEDFKGLATRYLLDFAVDPHPLGFSTTADGVRHARVEFALIAYDGNGNRLNYVDRDVTINLTDALYEQVMHGGIAVHQEIDLPEGVIYLRLVAQIALTAGPSTTLRSGRDDKFVLKSMISHDNSQFCNKIVIPTGAQRSGPAVNAYFSMGPKQATRFDVGQAAVTGPTSWLFANLDSSEVQVAPPGLDL